MSKLKKQIKQKQIKKDSDYDDEESEEEEDGDYVHDDFLVADDAVDDDEIDEEEESSEVDDENEEDLNLDEDELDLIEKKPKKVKLKRVGQERVKREEEDDLFDEERDEEKERRKKRRKEVDEEEENYENNFEEDEFENKKGKKRKRSINVNEKIETEELTKADKLKRLAKIYSKEELEEEYITEIDGLIKQIDIPERLLKGLTEYQLSEIQSQIKNKESIKLFEVSGNEILNEVDFIFDKLKSSRYTSSDKQTNQNKIKEKIKLVLSNMKVDFFEVPFIALYRKMNYEPELSQGDIWKIYELDVEWRKLKLVKEQNRKNFDQLRGLKFDNEELLIKKYIENVRSVEDLWYIESFIAYIKKYYSEEIENIKSKQEKEEKEEKDEGNYNDNNTNLINLVDSTTIKNTNQNIHIRPTKTKQINKKQRDVLIEIGRSFSLTPIKFAENIDQMKQGHQIQGNPKLNYPRDPIQDPAEFIKQFLNEINDNSLELMKSVISFLSEELLFFPPIRHFLFGYLRQSAFISTKPTEKGVLEIDIFHHSFRVKRLLNKPINTFNNDLYMELHKAYKEGLITYSIDYDDSKLKDFLFRISKIFVKPDESDLTKKWNYVRNEVIKSLISSAKPEFKKRFETLLIVDAEKFIIDQACINFYSLLMTGPYKKQESNSGKSLYFEDSPKTLSMVLSHENDFVYSVMLDEYGEIKDVQSFMTLLTKPENANSETALLEKTKLKEMIDKYHPDLIVISANHIKSKSLKDNISTLVVDSSIWITFGDLTIPIIFSTSSVADMKYTNFNTYVKQAISMGRYKQNPLAETLQLWNENINTNGILSLVYHPLQKMVNQKVLSEALEIEAIKVTNLIGVDLNRAKDHFHLRKQLGFVSGLGPRKSMYLIEKITLVGELINRNHIRIYFDDKITTNCSGFLKIKQYLTLGNQSISQNNQLNQNIILSSNLNKDTNLLDMTRIHPEMYFFAMKTIEPAVESKKFSNDNLKIEYILFNPSVLNENDIKTYIKSQEDKGNYKVKPILELIADELTKPFYDPRKSHKDLAEYELFRLLTNDNSIEIGHMVLARVNKVTKTHVFCRLDNDLEGSLWKNDIFDTPEIDEEQKMIDMFPKNSLFYARVKGINKSTFKVDLTTRPSKLISHKDELKVSSIDEYFQINEEEDFQNRYYKEVKENSQIRKYTKRNINNPFFKNFNYKQTIEYLKSKQNGDFLFRPSSKGSNMITLTWRVYENIYSNIQIIEEDKPQGASIGLKLRISNEIYSSLPEIVERYVKVCDRIVKENSSNRKFFTFNSIEELDLKLKADKQTDPVYVHYCYTLLPEYPQYFIFAYIPKPGQIVKEFIKIKPKGLFFHDDYFLDLNEISSFFKNNYSSEKYRSFVKKTKPPHCEINTINHFPQDTSGISQENSWGYGNNTRDSNEFDYKAGSGQRYLSQKREFDKESKYEKYEKHDRQNKYDYKSSNTDDFRNERRNERKKSDDW